jgi:hypothetical protein
MKRKQKPSRCGGNLAANSVVSAVFNKTQVMRKVAEFYSLPYANALMTNKNPVLPGITIITSHAKELEKIDPKNRFSVQH